MTITFYCFSVKKLDKTLQEHHKFWKYFVSCASSQSLYWKTNKISNSLLSPCKYTPIWHNPDLQLHNTPIYFPLWQQKGITHQHYLFTNNNFISSNTLCQKYGIRREQFLQYQKLKSLIKI